MRAVTSPRLPVVARVIAVGSNHGPGDRFAAARNHIEKRLIGSFTSGMATLYGLLQCGYGEETRPARSVEEGLSSGICLLPRRRNICGSSSKSPGMLGERGVAFKIEGPPIPVGILKDYILEIISVQRTGLGPSDS